jgi:hypothetical protein
VLTEFGVQACTHPGLDSEGENVSSAKLGHVIGNGVQFTGDPDRPPVNVSLNATIINLDNKILNDVVGVGTTKDLFRISTINPTQSLDSTQVIHVVIQVKITQKGEKCLKGIESSQELTGIGGLQHLSKGERTSEADTVVQADQMATRVILGGRVRWAAARSMESGALVGPGK